MVSRRTYLRRLCVTGAGVATAGCSGTGTRRTTTSTPVPYLDGTLDIYVSPSEPPETKRKWYRPIRDYLADQLAVEATITYGKTYAAVVDALGSGNADFADLGPLSAALGSRVGDLEIVLQRMGFGNWTYGSVLVTRADNDVDAVADLAGRHVAFADRLSTSGALMPLFMLQQAGLDIGSYPMDTESDADFDASFTSHPEAWNRLKRGEAAAAGVGRYITYDRDAGRVKQGFEYLDQYRNLPDPPFVTGVNLSDTETAALVDALVAAPDRVFYGADGEASTADDPWFTDLRKASAVRYQSVIDAAEAVGIKRELLQQS